MFNLSTLRTTPRSFDMIEINNARVYNKVERFEN